MIAVSISGTACGNGASGSVPDSAVRRVTAAPLQSSTNATLSSTVGPTALRKSQSTGSTIGLNDDFSADTIGGPAQTWTVASGKWSVCQSGAVHAYCQASNGTSESLNGLNSWVDYVVEAQVVVTNTSQGYVGIVGHAISPTKFYLFEIRPKMSGSIPYWYLQKLDGNTATVLASGPLNAPDKNPNYGLRLTFSGNQISAAIAFDGGTTFQVVCAGVIDSSYSAGQIGVRTYNTTTGQYKRVSVTLSNPALISESAVSSDMFVGSIGMNAHFESSTYSQHLPVVNSLISNLGVRYYRVSAGNILYLTGYASELAALHQSYGTQFDVLSDIRTTPAQVVQAIQLLPVGSITSVEGPNESDNPGQGIFYDANFATDVPAYVRSLYTMIKSTAATSQLSVIGPSFVNSTSYAAIGSISTSVDSGNMHNYFSGFNPGTQGWGGSGYPFAPSLYYGSIDWNIASASQATGLKPTVTTETGYSTAPIHSAVPLDVQAKYVPRMYFEQFRHNVQRTFMYQLIGYDTTTAEGTLDIVNPSLNPSPAYTALAGMIALLTEHGLSTSAVNYTWGLTGQVANVDHLLLHKANGMLIIPLWIEQPSYDVNANGGAGARISVTQQTVTVNFPKASATAIAWTCNPQTGAWASQTLPVINGSVTLNVGDSVSILEMTPA